MRPGPRSSPRTSWPNWAAPSTTWSPNSRTRCSFASPSTWPMEVQQNLLPGVPPRVKGFQVAGRSIYSDQTGGDYYDFLVLNGDRPHCLGVAIGDVTGHGIAAALLMTTARAMVRSLACGPGRMAEMISVVNQRLTDDTYAGRFMTLFYLVIDVDRRSLHWVASGHDPAVVYDPDQDLFEEMSGSDIPLGINPDWKFKEFSRSDWSPGQFIVLGTDGIWESRNPQGEMFGKEALNRIIRDSAQGSAEDLIQGHNRGPDRVPPGPGPDGRRDRGGDQGPGPGRMKAPGKPAPGPAARNALSTKFGEPNLRRPAAATGPRCPRR